MNHAEVEHEYMLNAIIPPPIGKDTEGDRKVTRVVIDSRDRNLNLYPAPNNYEIVLDDDIDDVVRAQLIVADVPLSMYTVNSYFNKLNVVGNGIAQEVVLDAGDYKDSTSSLPSMIASKLNAVYGADTFQVSYNAAKDRYEFTAKVAFSLNFTVQPASASLHHLLGFRAAIYNSTATGTAPFSHVVNSEFRRNLNYNNYVILYIDKFDVNQGSSKLTTKSFAILTQNGDNNNADITEERKVIKHFAPPIPRLTKIKVTFTDRFGNLYDFQNADHRLEILFYSFRQRRKYGGLFVS